MPFLSTPNRGPQKTWIFIKADTANAAAVYAALAGFGAPLGELTPNNFIEPGKFYRMGRPPLMVDILPDISGVDFDTAWGKRIEVEIDAGLQVPFIDLDSLILAKLASGRPEDLADVAVLRQATRSLTKQPDEKG